MQIVKSLCSHFFTKTVDPEKGYFWLFVTMATVFFLTQKLKKLNSFRNFYNDYFNKKLFLTNEPQFLIHFLFSFTFFIVTRIHYYFRRIQRQFSLKIVKNRNLSFVLEKTGRAMFDCFSLNDWLLLPEQNGVSYWYNITKKKIYVPRKP